MSERSDWYDRWIFWAAVVGVAALGAAAYFAVGRADRRQEQEMSRQRIEGERAEHGDAP